MNSAANPSPAVRERSHSGRTESGDNGGKLGYIHRMPSVNMMIEPVEAFDFKSWVLQITVSEMGFKSV